MSKRKLANAALDEGIVTIDPGGRTNLKTAAIRIGVQMSKHYRLERHDGQQLLLVPIALPDERWVPCAGCAKGYEYEISNQGRFRRLSPYRLVKVRAAASNPRDYSPLVRMAVPEGTPGTHRLNADRGNPDYYVWRSLAHLVLENFGVPKPFDSAVVRFRNGDHRDCSLANIHWGKPTGRVKR